MEKNSMVTKYSDKFDKVITFQNMADLVTFCEEIAKTDFVQGLTPNEIATAMLIGNECGLHPMTSILLGRKLRKETVSAVIRGKKLGLDPITAIENIYYIDDENSSTGVHIITGLLLKAGVQIEFLEDCVPLYKYRDKSGNEFEAGKLPPETVIITGSKEAMSKAIKDAEDNRKLPVILLKEVDYRTTVKMTRQLLQPNGSYKEVSNTISYSTADAKNVIVSEKTGKTLMDKSNWKNHYPAMLRNRCISLCGRLIGDDLIQGIKEHTELADILDIPYTIDDNGEVIEIGTEEKVKEN